MRGCLFLCAGLCLIAALCLSPLTRAAYDLLGSGLTKLSLDRGFLTLLRQNGAKLSAAAPASLKGNVLTLPVSGLDAKTASSEIDAQPSPPYAGKAGRVAVAGLGLTAPMLANAKARTVTVSGATLALQAATAHTFNEVFAKPQGRDGVFMAGEMLEACRSRRRGSRG